jgi:hypothetical protein
LQAFQTNGDDIAFVSFTDHNFLSNNPAILYTE